MRVFLSICLNLSTWLWRRDSYSLDFCVFRLYERNWRYCLVIWVCVCACEGKKKYYSNPNFHIFIPLFLSNIIFTKWSMIFKDQWYSMIIQYYCIITSLTSSDKTQYLLIWRCIGLSTYANKTKVASSLWSWLAGVEVDWDKPFYTKNIHYGQNNRF